MKNKMFLVLLILVLACESAISEEKKPYCPFVADLSTGEVIRSKGSYKCFASLSAAKKAGFVVGASSGGAPVSNLVAEFNGSVDTITRTFVVSRVPAVVSYSHFGKGHFSITTYKPPADYQDLLINEIGGVQGESRIYEKGTYYLDISASGTYSIRITQ